LFVTGIVTLEGLLVPDDSGAVHDLPPSRRHWQQGDLVAAAARKEMLAGRDALRRCSLWDGRYDGWDDQK
jgi:hypothetical protein